MIKLNEIYQEDCITFMQKMREENMLVDVIVTSPPYNIGKDYGSNYNDNKTQGNYLDWLQDVAEKSFSILKEDSSFFLNMGYKSEDPLLPFFVAQRFEAAGYRPQNNIIWLKSVSIDPDDIGKQNGLNNNNDNISIGHFKPIKSERYLTNLYEYIFHFTKTGTVNIDKLAAGVTYQDKSNIGRYADQDKRDRGNVWFITYPTINERRPHPAVFPIKLPQRCIELHGIKPNMLIYDPFMGIGNTALACVRLGVNYIGTEINPEYIKTSNEDISRLKPTLESPTITSKCRSGTLLSYFSAPVEQAI